MPGRPQHPNRRPTRSGSLTPMVSAAPSSSSRPPFGRVATAMVTPFAADRSLDLDAAQRLASYLVDNGNDALVVSGTTGESPTTTDAEKVDLLRAVLEAVGDRATVVAGVGTNNTAHTIECAKQAEAAGAHGLLGDVPATTQVLAQTDLAIYCGADELNLPWLAMGAVGVVSVVGHVAGKEYRAMVDAVDAGDLATARSIDRRLAIAVEAIMTRTQGVITAKAALKLAGVLEHATTRPPLVDPTPEQFDWLTTDLKTSGLLP